MLRRPFDADMADHVNRLAAMTQARYTHRHCTICHADKDFKVIEERDIMGRMLIVCTRCGSKIPVPGQKNPRWAQLLEDDA